MISNDIKAPRARQYKLSKSIAPYIDGFGRALLEDGYSPLTTRQYVCAAVHLGGWSESRGLTIAAFDDSTVICFWSIPFKVTTPRNHSVLLDRNGLAPIFGLMIHSQTPLKTGVLSTLKGLVSGGTWRSADAPRDTMACSRPPSWA